MCFKYYELEIIHNVSTDNISSMILQVKIIPLWLYFLCPSYLNITLNFTLNILVGDFRCNTDNTTLLQRRICSIHSKYVLNIKQQLKKNESWSKIDTEGSTLNDIINVIFEWSNSLKTLHVMICVVANNKRKACSFFMSSGFWFVIISLTANQNNFDSRV